MKQDHEDPLDSPVQLAHLEVRASQDRLESQVQWVNPGTEDQTDLQENQDLMENLELQVLQETLASLDLWEREGSQVCPDYLESRVIRAWQVWLAQKGRLEL